MSEYQYYEFRTVDRPLGRTEQRELHAISTRAQITAAGFVNHYEWGDFKGNPDRFMERYFDLFLYHANWGSRRFSVRVPKRLLDPASVKQFIIDSECATLRTAGESLIVDVVRDEIEYEDDYDDDCRNVSDDDDDGDGGDGRLDVLASLRGDILDGDLRLFYLVWLMAVENGEAPDDAIEPLAGIGPLTPSLKAFAECFCIGRDLVAAAADAIFAHPFAEPPRSAVIKTIDGLSEREKAACLLRLYDDDPHLGPTFAAAAAFAQPPWRIGSHEEASRSCAESRGRLADERDRAEAARMQAEQQRREQEETKARKRRLDALAQRGEAAWSDVESLIALRNPHAYDKTAALLADLRDLALRKRTDDDFHYRLVQLRTRHKTKSRLVERLTAAGLD